MADILLILVIILLSMTLHEAIHGFVAYYLGDDTAEREGRLTLNPIKHIDPFMTILLPLLLAIAGGPIFGGAKPVPFNPDRLKYDEWGAALVAASGPLVNLFIAFVAFGLAVVSGVSSDDGVARVLYLTMVVNLGFFVFNMIPIPPLDGSRVLYALAPDFFRRGMEYVERYGIIVVFAIVLLASSVIASYMRTSIDFFVSVFSKIFGV
jgi:Zn-dependent protease